MIVSNDHFIWFVTAVVLAACAGWGARDAYLLYRNLSRRRTAPADRAARRDQTFGAAVGLVLVVIGLVGVVRYHLSR